MSLGRKKEKSPIVLASILNNIVFVPGGREVPYRAKFCNIDVINYATLIAHNF